VLPHHLLTSASPPTLRGVPLPLPLVGILCILTHYLGGAHVDWRGCREMTSFSDFPLKPTASLFPTCGEMEAYLADYVAHFDLGRFIRLRTEVVHLKRIDGSSPGTDRWLVTCKSGTVPWPTSGASTSDCPAMRAGALRPDWADRDSGVRRCPAVLWRFLEPQPASFSRFALSLSLLP
jgi:hypothetical protein